MKRRKDFHANSALLKIAVPSNPLFTQSSGFRKGEEKKAIFWLAGQRSPQARLIIMGCVGKGRALREGWEN
jgi:hypothetical protein